jgi:hypothetical protein
MLRIVAVAVLVAGCSKGPTAAEVCTRLEAAGAAQGCKAELPGGIGAAAAERATFTVPGQTYGGQVLRFGSGSDYDATIKAFDAAAALAGRHRYGSAGARIFVQLNSETPEDTAAKARTVVGAL